MYLKCTLNAVDYKLQFKYKNRKLAKKTEKKLTPPLKRIQAAPACTL